MGRAEPGFERAPRRARVAVAERRGDLGRDAERERAGGRRSCLAGERAQGLERDGRGRS